ncbi:glycosyltransferase family 2 protein [Ihuprevotella massiliensis]|uniref:glycosyltransferase family 2 protein n=1 Tax=Ihuprevotella massiliensis TaxID=1852368 RepID=UPI00094F1A6A
MAEYSLTVFTPTYNRAHLIGRVYESLCQQTCQDFEWLVIDDGSTDNTREVIAQYIAEQRIAIRYIWKENGGLYTGYNTAYANITSPLNVCIDSDDFMPENAVELILEMWNERGGEQYAGIIGLDFYADKQQPIGGYFPENLQEVSLNEISEKGLYKGDAKQVMRSDLTRTAIIEEDFHGEKDFNPYSMVFQAANSLPLLVINDNLCFVDYQPTGMAANIYKQYYRSPWSFMKMRQIEMTVGSKSIRNLLRLNIHYVSSCLIARNKHWLKDSPKPLLTLLMSPLGFLLFCFILWKNRH